MGAVVAPAGSVAGQRSQRAQGCAGAKCRGILGEDAFSDRVGQFSPAVERSGSRMLNASLSARAWPATAGALDFSRAAEADGDLAGFDDDGNLASAFGQFQHAFQARLVFEHVDVFEGKFTPGEVRTGSRSILSKILSKDDDFFFHGLTYVRLLPRP